MENLHFYPTITAEILDNAGCVCGKYDFSYRIEEQYKALRAKGKTTVRLEDSLESWKVENDGLRISRQISFEYPTFLYGDAGVAPSDSQLGVCIIWTNRNLTQMGYILPQSEADNNGKLIYNFLHEFEPGSIKGDLQLETVLYLKKSAEEVSEKEQNLVNIAGVTVGMIDEVSLDFDSLYMDFPIRDVKEKDQPLWWIEFNQWEDPTKDPFSEDTICLYLNSYYDYCPKVGDTIKNIELLIEIISTAYLMIFEKIRDMSEQYFINTIDGIDLEPGSIGMVMNYFYRGCDPSLKTESIDMLQKTIRVNIEKMLRGE